jgi:5'-nucleotidase
MTVAAGDLIGASPLLSALYHDEPTIEAMNLLGLSLTSGIVSPAGITHLKFLDEADTANHYAKALKRHGVKAIVVLLHQGGFQSVPFNTATVDACAGFGGDVTDIVDRTTKAVDVFITGHTHRPTTASSTAGRSRAPAPTGAW